MGQQDLANRWTFPLPLGTWELAAGQECSGQKFFKRVLRSLCVVWRFLGSLLLGEAGPPSLLPPCRQSLFAGAFFVVLFLSEAWTVVQSQFSVRASKICTVRR